MKPETIAASGVLDKAVDVDPILAQTKQGGCRPLHFEKGSRRKMLLNVVALIPPPCKGLEHVLVPHVQENCLESLVSLVGVLQLFMDGHNELADFKYFGVVMQLVYHLGRNKANLGQQY